MLLFFFFLLPSVPIKDSYNSNPCVPNTTTLYMFPTFFLSLHPILIFFSLFPCFPFLRFKQTIRSNHGSNLVPRSTTEIWTAGAGFHPPAIHHPTSQQPPPPPPFALRPAAARRESFVPRKCLHFPTASAAPTGHRAIRAPHLTATSSISFSRVKTPRRPRALFLQTHATTDSRIPVHHSKGGNGQGTTTNPPDWHDRPRPSPEGHPVASHPPSDPRHDGDVQGPATAPHPAARPAAADERVLAEFLEASLRVPDLSLPPRKRFDFPPAPAPPPESDGISSRALVSGDADTALWAVTAAAESGAFRVTGAIDAREVRDAVEAAAGAVFAAPEEVKRDLGRWFRRRERAAGAEFFWFRPMSADEDRALHAAFHGSTYRAFREKIDTLASKMEDVAKVVIRVLSDNVKNPKASAQFREAPSILCLTLYSSNMSRTCWNEFDNTTAPNSHALSIHLCGHDRRICLRNLGGSTFCSLPAGCMLVTIGKQIQEWSNGQFKTSVGEVLFEMTDEPGPFISVELMYCPDDLHLSEVGRHASRIDRPKIVSFRDQILIALILLSFFYLFWC